MPDGSASRKKPGKRIRQPALMEETGAPEVEEAGHALDKRHRKRLGKIRPAGEDVLDLTTPQRKGKNVASKNRDADDEVPASTTRLRKGKISASKKRSQEPDDQEVPASTTPLRKGKISASKKKSQEPDDQEVLASTTPPQKGKISASKKRSQEPDDQEVPASTTPLRKGKISASTKKSQEPDDQEVLALTTPPQKGKISANKKKSQEPDDQQGETPAAKRRGKAIPEEAFAPSEIETPLPNKSKSSAKNAASTKKIKQQLGPEVAESKKQPAKLAPQLSKGAAETAANKQTVAAIPSEDTSAAATATPQPTADAELPEEEPAAAIPEKTAIADAEDQRSGVVKTASKNKRVRAVVQVAPEDAPVTAEVLDIGQSLVNGKKAKKTIKKGKKAKARSNKAKHEGAHEDDSGSNKERRLKRSSTSRNLSTTALAGDLDEIPEPEPFLEQSKQQDMWKWKGSFAQGMKVVGEQASF